MLSSILFAGVGVLGAGYSVVVSGVAINQGPCCEVQVINGTLISTEWKHPFENGWDKQKGGVVVVSVWLASADWSISVYPFPLQELPIQQDSLGQLPTAEGRGALASDSVLHAADNGFDPDRPVCCAGDQRSAGSSVWGLLRLLWRGQYPVWSDQNCIFTPVNLEP